MEPQIETAKEVAGKTIGKQGLFYITLIIVVGVGASIVLDEGKMAAVMGLLSAALMALISMMNGVAGGSVKEEKPEFKVMHDLIERLDKSEVPMRVDVEAQEVSKRWQADAGTDSWLAKNIRPMTLIFILCAYSFFAFMSMFDYETKSAYVELLGQWGMLVMTAYFGGRSLEKIMEMKNNSKAKVDE